MADALELNDIQRRRLLDELHGSLLRHTPNLSDTLLPHPAGNPVFFDRYLDGLVQIARRSTASQLECYLSQILDNVCACCAYQQHSGFCQLRHANVCPLYCCAGPVLESLNRALKEFDLIQGTESEPETACTTL
jgi:hypothetical protein